MEHKPLTFAGIEELPNLVVSLASMEWNRTGSWRYLKPRYENKVPPCSNGCPAGNDIEGFIRLAGEGKYAEAWARLKEENPLTRVCGRVCFHPCETACNRKNFDLAVSINALERFVGEHADRSIMPGIARQPSGKTVAVVGSGPAGLTAAFLLARMGHAVAVFESMPKPGGVLRYGIPAYRLPREVLDDEIEDVRSLGVEIRCGVKVGPGADSSYDDLKKYDAVFLAIGAHKSRKLGVPGENAPKVLSGLGLLRAIAAGDKVKVGKRAAVIGGGNTALDAARALLRLGARADVYYRRSRAEMPAFEEEIEEAVREGVGVHMLVAPAAINLNEKGKVVGLTMVRMRLAEPDESGRRKPEPMEGSEHEVEADTVIAAVGEQVDNECLPEGIGAEADGSVRTDDFGATGSSRLWAGGDVTPILRTVVTAIGAGKRAAVAIDKYLAGAAKEELDSIMRIGPDGNFSVSRYLATGSAHSMYDNAGRVVAFEDLNTAHFKRMERGRQVKIPVAERLKSFVEVNRGLDAGQAAAEAERCFHCGVCTECDNCYVFCPDISIIPRVDAFGYEIDLDYCKGCGICVNECPRSSMAISEE